jgi:transposase
MRRRIQLKAHLTTEDLTRRYLVCQKAQEKTRGHALYLISKGVMASEVARRVGRSSGWMTQLVSRYNQQGPDSIPRKTGEISAGGPPKLSASLAKELDQALRSRAPHGGLWTGSKGAAWISHKSGQDVHHWTGWRALRRLGFSLQVPRPSNKRRASVEEQAAFKKS